MNEKPKVNFELDRIISYLLQRKTVMIFYSSGDQRKIWETAEAVEYMLVEQSHNTYYDEKKGKKS